MTCPCGTSGVGEDVSVGVCVLVGDADGVGVSLGMGVTVAVWVADGVNVSVEVGVSEGMDVAVEVAEAVAVGVAVAGAKNENTGRLQAVIERAKNMTTKYKLRLW